MFEQVSVDDRSQLLQLVRRYKRIRTYPAARDAHQRSLHEHVVALSAAGSVKLVEQNANDCVWEA